MIEIRVNLRDLERITRASQEDMGFAIRAGIRAAQTHLKKVIAPIISDHTGVKRSSVREQLNNFIRPSVQNAATGFSLTQKKFYLEDFRARQTRSGVTAWPYRKTEQFKSAFLVPGSGFMAGKVMRRDKEDPRYDGRFPIKPPASVRLLFTKKVYKEINHAAETLVGREITRILRQRGTIQ